MTAFSLVSIVAAFIYAALAFVVVRRSPKAGLNWFCGFILISYTVWASGNVVHHLQPLVSYDQAHLAHQVGMIGVYCYASSWLLFALALTNRRKYLRSWLTYVTVPASSRCSRTC
jgi:fluoride ion exporter CrcB/FEX